MEWFQDIPYLVILKILGQHTLTLIVWAIVFFLLGGVLSFWCVRKLHRLGWFRRHGSWNYAAMLYYLFIPLVIVGCFTFSGLMLGALQVTKHEVHRARDVLQEESQEIFVSRFSEVTDTTFLKQGLLDSLAMEVIREQTGLRQGSLTDRAVRGLVYRTRQVLLFVATNEASGTSGIRRRHFNKLLEAYEKEDPEGVHEALLDILEHFTNKPIKAYVWSTIFVWVLVSVLLLLIPVVEIGLHLKRKKKASAQAT